MQIFCKFFTNFLKLIFFFFLQLCLENRSLLFITSSIVFLGTRLFCSFSPFELFILSFTKYLSGDNYAQNIKLDAVKNVKTSPISCFHKASFETRVKNCKKIYLFILFYCVTLCQLFVCLSVFPQFFNNKCNELYLPILLSSWGLAEYLHIHGIHCNKLLCVFSRTEVHQVQKILQSTPSTQFFFFFFIFPKGKRKTIKQKSYLWQDLKDLTQRDGGKAWRTEQVFKAEKV